MAKVTLTSSYSELGNWSPNLLAASDGVTIGTHSATTFSYTFATGTQFAGYTVTSTGTGFTYDGTTPTGGQMTGLTITDDLGHTVLTVSDIAPGSAAADLSLFAAYEFGWTDAGGGGPGAQVENAWSLLLSGKDVINGSSGDDTQDLLGLNAGNDVFNMGGGNDFVNGGLGNDTINGGDGWDTLNYSPTHWSEGIAMTRGITVTVDTGTVLDPYGFTDHFTGLEQIIGSALNDVFYGGTVEMNFKGLRGSDTFYGGSGGGWIYYDGDTGLGGNHGIVAKLGLSTSGGDIIGTIRDGFGSLDHTINVQNVGGTQYGDTFVGNALGNQFAGGEGEDSYRGGGGIDWLNLQLRFTGDVQHGAIVDLKLATGQVVDDGFGNTETAVSIENIWGTDQGDRISGSAGNNLITGNSGDDTMTGGGGSDTFQWDNRSDFGAMDSVTDFHAGSGAKQDYLSFHVTNWGGSTTLHLVNGVAAVDAVETFIFNAATHMLSWDADGTGAGNAVDIVVLNGVSALTADNFSLF